MTITAETYLVVALAFAVFAAITALGSSLVLGVGFERLRAGFEIIKNQTGYFSDAIHGLDKRLDSTEKQGRYFFESIHKLEQQQQAAAPVKEEAVRIEPQLISTSKSAGGKSTPVAQSLWCESDAREVSFH